MSYATRADLEERYADDVAQRDQVLPTLGVANALADASAEIDSYLAVLYQVPISPVPPTILRVACVIARYRLLGDAATEGARKDYEDARAFLRDVVAGRSQIEGAAALAGANPARNVQMVSNARVFSRSSEE
jgi:phage gp36-like protein